MKDKTKKDIIITKDGIEGIKHLVSQKLPLNTIAGFLNRDFGFSIDTSFVKYSRTTYKEFSCSLKEGCYSINDINDMLDNTWRLAKNVLDDAINENEGLSTKTKVVSILKVGDIVYVANLKHPFLILNVYKSGLFKAVSLSTKPDTRNSLPINSRFLDLTNYIRLTVSIYEIEEFKSKWVGNISQSQVKLVKQFLKSNKL